CVLTGNCRLSTISVRRPPMPTFTVYRQRRADGGLRTGVALNDVTCAQSFEPGSYDDDPSLEWYIDIRGEGSGVPDTAELLLEWLHQLSTVIQPGVTAAAAQIEVGVDSGVWP